MKDGVLVISAPKDVKKIEADSSQKIPIRAAEESKEEHVDRRGQEGGGCRLICASNH